MVNGVSFVAMTGAVCVRFVCALGAVACLAMTCLASEAQASPVDVVGYGAEGQLAFRSAELALGERVPYRLGMNSQGPTLTPVALSSPVSNSATGAWEVGPIFGSLLRSPLPPKPSGSPLLGLTAPAVLPQPFVEAIIMRELPVRQFALTFGGVSFPFTQSLPPVQSGGVGVVTIRGTAHVNAPMAAPIPGVLWLFGSGVAALGGAARVMAQRARRSAPESSSPRE